MSDNKTSNNYIVEVCRNCLTLMSIVVIVCRTMSNLVLAQEFISPSESTDIQSQSDGIIVEDTQNHGNENETTSIINEQSDQFDQGADQESISGNQLGEALELNNITPPTGDIEPLSGVILDSFTENEENNTQTNLITELKGGGDEVQAGMTADAPPPIPQINMTEVRIDGTDEYIELTNRGDEFNGDITLSGVKASLLTVSIHLNHNQSIIIGDSLAIAMLSGYGTILNQGLSMTDTVARSIQVIYSGQVIDSLMLSSSQVIGSDNQSASREYDSEQHLWQVTTIEHTRNMQAGQRGNPGVVRGLTVFGETTGSTITGIVITGSTSTGLVETGLILTGGIASGTINTGITLTGVVNTGSIQIQQVYPFGDCIGEHIALSFNASYQGQLTIHGLGTSDSPKSFDITVTEPGIRYIVESLSGVLSDNVVLVSSITLTDGGESLILKDARGQIIDSVIYSNTSAGQASSYTTSSGGIRIFNTNQSPTIATSCIQAHELPQIGGCRIQMSDSLYDTGVFASAITVSGSLVSSGCSDSTRSVNGTPVTSNTCNLTQSLPAGSHRIVYQQYSGTSIICEDEIMFYGAIQAQSNAQTSSSTPSSCSASDKSYYEALYRKRKLKHDNLSNAVEYVGLSVTNNDDVYGVCDQAILSGDNLVSRMDPSKSTIKTRMMDGSRQLIIYDIIADGTGNDRDGTESVTIFNDSDSLIDLEGVMMVVNNKVVETLTGTLGVNSFLTLTDYFPLPNAGGCIALYKDGSVYDQVCYGKFTDKHVIDMETLRLPKSSATKTTKSTSKTTSKTSDTGATQGLFTLKSCLKLEEYDLLKLDIKEQTLINTAQKKLYQAKVDDAWAQYRTKTNELYTTYRSISDSKQTYIDKQQSYIDSQKSYIDKLKSQISSCSSYSTRITEIYNNNKSYTETLKTSSKQLYDLKSQITNNYPALTNDPAIAAIVGVDTGSMSETKTALTSKPKSNSSRRSTIKQTIAHLF